MFMSHIIAKVFGKLFLKLSTVRFSHPSIAEEVVVLSPFCTLVEAFLVALGDARVVPVVAVVGKHLGRMIDDIGSMAAQRGSCQPLCATCQTVTRPGSDDRFVVT